MAQKQTADIVPQAGKSVARRIIELACGLAIILIAIGASKFWIEARNAGRADTFVLRRTVQITLETARSYQVGDPGSRETAAAWQRFLDDPSPQDIDPGPAHEFADSFMVNYRDGRLDSLEAGRLYRQLMTFQPNPN